MIPEEKVREVAERTSIVDVVSDYLQLRRSGANFSGLCPFHAEKTPSFTVNPAREIFHCFGCGVGGSAFSFIMKIEGVTFPEAVKHLARKAGVEIEERQLTTAEKDAQNERQQFQKINQLAGDYFRKLLLQEPSGEPARQYLSERAVSDDLLKDYALGFAGDRRDGLVRYLREHNVALETAQKLGIIRKDDSGSWRDLFRNRLMFPIREPKGNIIAFAGRVLDSSLPKYINSPESPLYHKSSVMYGADMALPTVRTENAIIIVEGYFDHLALYKAGIRNVVATCGTALTTTHAGFIKRHAAKVYMLFDSDNAGTKATFRSMELFMEQRMPAYVISLPKGDDPDSFLAKNSVEAFQILKSRARSAFEHYIHWLLAATPPDSVDNKVRLIDELIPRFRKIADPIERDLYEKEICRLLNITVHAFRKRISGIKFTDKSLENSAISKTDDHGERQQETLLALMIKYPEARVEVSSFGLENMFSGAHKLLAKAIIAVTVTDDDKAEISRLLDILEDDEQKKILSQLLVNDEYLADIEWRTVFEQCKQSREKRSLQSLRSIAARLAVLDSDSDEYKELLQQADDLRTRKSKM